MCQSCVARGLAEDACNDVLGAGGSVQASGGATAVDDERAILATLLTSDDNWRWNAESALGTSVVVTYSFASGFDLPSAFSSTKNPYGASSFSSLSASQKSGFRQAASDFMASAGIVLVEVQSGGMIDVYNANNSSVGGWAWLPYVTGGYVGDVDMVVDHSGDFEPGSYGYYLLLHELGHALGLSHPFQDGGDAFVLQNHLDHSDNTVMSYNYRGGVTDLGALDVAAMQALYGASVTSAGWDYSLAGSMLTARGGAGADNLMAARGVQDQLYVYTVYGGNGADNVTGEAGADRLYGQNGGDTLSGLGGSDRIWGGKGSDTINGGNGDDYMHGGVGWDLLYGGAGNDTLLGRAGRDTLYGEAGNDLLEGFNGSDHLYGGDGNDVLCGGRGLDTLTGGGGVDTFVFVSNDMSDVVTDFDATSEKIRFDWAGVSYADLSISTYSGGVLVEAGSVDIWLEGVLIGDIGADDFLFS